MKVLNNLDSLDNIQDGNTRKLITKVSSSGSGNAVSGISVSGDTINFTKTNAKGIGAIPKEFGESAVSATAGDTISSVNYGYGLWNGILKSIPILNLSGDLFYRCHERGATTTSNYNDVASGLSNGMFNGSYSGYYTTINPSTDFQTKPLVIEMTRPQSFEFTDVTRLYLVGHRFAEVHSKKYKIEVAYNYTNGEYLWATAYNYDSETTQNVTNRFFGLFNKEESGSTSNWYGIYGIRITFYESTDTVFQLAEIMLINNRGTELPYQSLHAFGDVGGTLYGGIEPYANETYNLGTSSKKWNNVYATTFNGNATTATKATQDKDGNQIDTTYLKKSGGDLSGSIRFLTTAANPSSLTFEENGYDDAFRIIPSFSGADDTNKLFVKSKVAGESDYTDKITIAAKTGNTTFSGMVTAPKIETGTADSSYFQSKKFRGEGDADTYYHAVDFGYNNHDRVDFYEYGAIWNFWKNTTATPTSDTANQALGITLTALKNQGNTYTFPKKDGTFALTGDIPSKTSDLTNDSNFHGIYSGTAAPDASLGSNGDIYIQIES